MNHQRDFTNGGKKDIRKGIHEIEEGLKELKKSVIGFEADIRKEKEGICNVEEGLKEIKEGLEDYPYDRCFQPRCTPYCSPCCPYQPNDYWYD